MMVHKTIINKSDNQAIEILELAVRCRLITSDREKAVLPRLMEWVKINPGTPPAQFFYTEKILEKEQVRFLYTVKKHLDTLVLDKKFGRLGVANEFVSPENVQKALDIQVKIFKQHNKSVKIGDILLNNHEISESNKTAIMLTQDRIRDEYLADALNAIAGNEMQKIAISKRFGAIAVKKKLITTDQLNQALKQQKVEFREKKEHRYLGAIFREMGCLTTGQILMVLKIQQKLETKRLNLQKKLAVFNSQNETGKMLDQFFELKVSQDKLSAYIIPRQEQASGLDADDVISWLSGSGIKFGVVDKKQIQAWCKRMKSGVAYLVAQGQQSAASSKEQITFHSQINSDPSDDAGENTEPILVKKDDVLATVTPFEPGMPGKDVFGHPIPPEQDTSVILKSGEGVAKRGNDFVAVIDGRPRLYKNRTLFVMPAQGGLTSDQIDGDLTGEHPDEFRRCRLVITGSITAGASIVCHELLVKGDVKGNIKAIGDVEIAGYVGHDEDDNNQEPEIQISTQGRLSVKGKSVCANIVAANGLFAPSADIVNSEVMSSGNVVAKNIRSDKESPTMICIARENLLALQKLENKINEADAALDALSHQSELDALHAELMKQAQVQNSYLEKQNVLNYLVKIIENPELTTEQPLELRVAAFETKSRQGPEGERQETIPENTKAYVFLKKLLKKVKPMKTGDQERYIKELATGIVGIYRAAIRGTDRINKQYEARKSQVDIHVEQHKDQIRKLEEQVNTLLSQRDLLLVESTKTGTGNHLLIKIKNEVEPNTRIRGETDLLTVDKSIFGVCIREERGTEKNPARIIVEGYYE